MKLNELQPINQRMAVVVRIRPFLTNETNKEATFIIDVRDQWEIIG